MQFQVRSESHGIQFFDNFNDAYIWAQKHNGWKISYSTYNPVQIHRWVKMEKGEHIENITQEEIGSVCHEYKNAKEGEIFWYDQPLDPVISIVDGKRQIKFNIQGILSDQKFRELHN